MKPTTPIWLFNKYLNLLLDRLLPLRKTKVAGLSFYYLPGSPPYPSSFRSGYELQDRVRLQKGNVAIDVGAHIGSYSLLLAKGFKRVIAFEPNPVSSHLLRLNITLNDFRNVSVEEVALSDNDGRMPLYIQNDLASTSSLKLTHYGLKFDRTHEVKVARLDDYLPTLERVDFIKVDAEGLELSILKGARLTIRRDKPTLGVEVHNSRVAFAGSCNCDTCHFLRTFHYEIKVVGEFVSFGPVHWVWATPSSSSAHLNEVR